MEKYFGFGEYERTDVEVKASTWFFRYQFLETLLNRKGNWTNDLSRIVKYNLLPPKLIEPEGFEMTFGFLFPCLFKKNPYDSEIRSDILDTPLYQYFSYFLDKEEVLGKRKSNIPVKYYRTEFDVSKDAIKEMIPDWNSLKSKEDAHNLRLSLENWAKNYNLNEDWFLDYILLILSNFKSYLDLKFKDFDFGELTTEKINSYTTYFEYGYSESLRQGLSDFHSDKVTINLFDIDKNLKAIPFEFKHEAFEYVATWFPRIKQRKEFIDETMADYNRRVEEIKIIDQYKYIDEESHRIALNEYCDEIEERKSKKQNENLFPAFPKGEEEIIIHSAVWKPSLQKREIFIKNFIIELNHRFRGIKCMARSLETIGKDDFSLALWSYCENVEKKMPENYAKTPTKYCSQTHFDWLVDFQVSPFKEYEVIVKEMDSDKRPTISAVKRANSRLAKNIGISLRKVPRTGRPNGVIETHKRYRVGK